MAPTKGWVRKYRGGFALLALLAIVFQYRQMVVENGFPLVNFLSFFTIQGNLFAVWVLLWGAMGNAGQPSAPARDLIRGAAVLYLAITGVVYGVLLAGYQEELQTTIPWVDTVVHRIIPLVMVADWLIDPPTSALTFRKALVWMAYPLLYVVYTLLRGPMAAWYPYPFLDPMRTGGYVVVALYCLGIGLATLLFMWLVVTIGRRLRLVTSPP